MEEEKILNVTQLGVVDKLQNEDVILLIRNTDNGKQCFQIKGFDFRGESAYEAALSQGFEGTYSEWVQQIKEVTEYDTKTLLSFKGIAFNDANKALTSGIYPNVTANIPITGETFTIQTLRTTTAVYNQYVSTQIALGVTGAAIGKIYIRKNTQKSGKTTYEDWIDLTVNTDTDTIYKYVARQVTNGAWIPVKAGRTRDGVTIVDGAVAEGIDTEAIGECSHAEGKHVTVTRKYGHSEGVFNYNDSYFIRTLGVGTSYTKRINAEVVYAKETGPDGLPDSSDPKNGYKYLLGVGGYKGQVITEGMKSVQEVISDLENKISVLEAKKSKPKTQYIIGKAIPIGKLNGGARLNAYAVRFGNFRFKLSNVPQIRHLISNNKFNEGAVDELLKDVTWHVFIDDEEVYTGGGTTTYGAGVLYIYILSLRDDSSFYQLDESKSSVDLSSDMYIYLMGVSSIRNKNCTSKTLFYHKNRRIWKPAFESPYISYDTTNGNLLQNSHSGYIQIQRLHTTQNRSRLSVSSDTFSVRKYRGHCDNNIKYYGTYRYRLVKNGKKTQWRTISLMRNPGFKNISGITIPDIFFIK